MDRAHATKMMVRIIMAYDNSFNTKFNLKCQVTSRSGVAVLQNSYYRYTRNLIEVGTPL